MIFPDWTEAQVAAYTFRAEIRAIEEGHRTRRLPDGRYRVVSHEEPDVAYYLGWETPRPGAALRVSCTCPSGVHRAALPIPCKHAALVARRLESRNEGRLVVWSDGLWRDRRHPTCSECGASCDDHGLVIDEHAPDCPIASPDDPFADL